MHNALPEPYTPALRLAVNSALQRWGGLKLLSDAVDIEKLVYGCF